MQENNSIIIAMLEELLTISKSQRTEQTVNANVDLTPIKEAIGKTKSIMILKPINLQALLSMNLAR